MTLGRNFSRTLAASGFANLADGVFQVALPLLAVQLTRSPLLIAGVNLAARLPWLLALVAGALFDTSAQSLLPALVPREALTTANSRLFAVELVANTFVGPPLGGLLAAAGLAVAMGVPA